MNSALPSDEILNTDMPGGFRAGRRLLAKLIEAVESVCINNFDLNLTANKVGQKYSCVWI